MLFWIYNIDFERMYNVDSISLYFIITLLYKNHFVNDYYFIIRPLIYDIIIFIITLSTKFFFGRKRTELKTNVKRLFGCRNSENNCSMLSGDSMQAANFVILILFFFGNFIGYFLCLLLCLEEFIIFSFMCLSLWFQL